MQHNNEKKNLIAQAVCGTSARYSAKKTFKADKKFKLKKKLKNSLKQKSERKKY